MEFHERLKQYVDYKGLSVSTFEKETPINQGVVAKCITNKTILNGKNIQKISIAWPDLNINWLMTERGEMINIDINHYQERMEKIKKEADFWKDFAISIKGALKEQYPQK